MENYALDFICDSCGGQYSLNEPLTLCPDCGGLLETRYDIPAMKNAVKDFDDSSARSIWKYRKMLPPVGDADIVSLGEGCTPLVPSLHLSKELGMKRLYFKNDTMMPTGSFKDRGFSLAVSYARKLNVKRAFTYSSGNAGASFAAYAARVSLPSLVCVEYVANKSKMAMIKLFGAHTAVLRYNNFDEISNMLKEASENLGIYQFVNFINPIRHEAMKTYAYEIYEDLGRAPDAMFHPVGTGGGLWGAYKGFCELAAIGMTDRVPRMYAVQPADCAHFKEAFDRGDRQAGRFGDASKTAAQSIASDAPIQGGKRVLKAVYDTKGAALGVTDEEIFQAMRDLAREWIAAEPSAASAVAGLKRAVSEGKLGGDDIAVCVITGSGLKQPQTVETVAGMPEHSLYADAADLKRLLTELGV